MADLVTAYARALAAPAPPVTVTGFLEALGGIREGTRALALLRIGRPADGPLPAAGSDDYREYRSARRTIERWRNFEAGSTRQGRRPSTAWLQDHRNVVRAVATRRRIEQLRRRGMRCRMSAEIIVSKDRRVRELPAGGPGQLLGPADTRRVTAPALEGDFATSAGLWLAVFLERYTGGSGADFTVGEVGWVRLWADGEAEPDARRARR